MYEERVRSAGAKKSLSYQKESRRSDDFVFGRKTFGCLACVQQLSSLLVVACNHLSCRLSRPHDESAKPD